jgi:hypothetical protein
MKKQVDDCLGSGGTWRIPVPPIHEHALQDVLLGLRAACAATTRSLRNPASRERFEREEVAPVYGQVQRELGWLLRGWGMTAVMLPDFTGARATADGVQRLCRQNAGSFQAECSLQHAARVGCLFWTLRHVGVELLGQVWADESFSWSGRLGPQCYSHSTEFPSVAWDLATGRATDDGGIVEPLGRLVSDEGRVVRDPDWARLALRGEFEESYWGEVPLLPLVAWASTAGWPSGLWDRVCEVGDVLGSWVVASEQFIGGTDYDDEEDGDGGDDDAGRT